MHTKDDIVKIYDDMFNLIGTETWSVVHKKGLLHQVVHLWIYSDAPEERWLYFIQRSKAQDIFPGLYDLPVSGHIDPEETFSHAVITLSEERLGLKLTPDQIQHAGNIHQIIDRENYHDNAFCQSFIRKLELPAPEFHIQGAEMIFKVKYHDFCQWIEHPEGRLPIYTSSGEFISESITSDWWQPRKEEFMTVVKPYIETH